MTTRIDLDAGKYSVCHDGGTNLRALRYGDAWRDLSGDKLVLAMALEIERLRAIRDEVHQWIVCAAIATDADMMASGPRICEITDPNFEGML